MFTIARTAKGRPTLQHELDTKTDGDSTVCGIDVTLWSRSYQAKAFEPILCKKCNKHIQKENS